MGQEKKVEVQSQPAYLFVDSVSALQTFVRQAEGATTVAVDLEADSMFHYREKVCLLQMAANGQSVVIDPLKVPDLSMLKPLFSDHRISKVFHGADYDVRSLYRDFGININNLFDTQMACMYLGLAETGLEAVVGRRFGVELNKRYQKKDWSKRPLPEGMVTYAASDVAYLIPLAEALVQELDAKGRLSWVQEGCRMLSQVRPPENNQDPLFLRFRGAGRLTPRQLAVLESLLQIRDSFAQQKDRPWFKIVSNAALLKMATAMPTSIKQLEAGGSLSRKQMDMYGTAIVEAVQNALEIPRNQLPTYPRRKSPRLSSRIPPRVKALRTWRDQQAADLKLDPALLLNKALIRDIAIQRPLSKEALRQVPNIYQWQADDFGEQILKILNKMP